ncbi:FdhF/YdeP family oxidoreductase [Crenobacter cavernae]|uniref:CbbBc protein n=1 Tax=Crenobacter cavernae TaxID=2290923 RepID=A0ABY0FBY6_9NEIS|nr:FdhF/YdeP family oxidoreductase [Crenobacter cavernae]RXZ43596.1 CbbBc protein [Crenobacter cavernae]
MSQKIRIEPYPGAAGGWGALKSTTRHLLNSEQALTNLKTLANTNQPGGFDCPGCAWGEGKHSGRVSFCENGAKAVNWEATARRVDAAFFAEHSVASLYAQTDHWLESQGRLAEPMVYDAASDHYAPISWDDAFALIACHLKQLDSPDQAEFYTSGRTGNEAAFLYQLFVRAYGTNNFPDCSNLCHEASGVALRRSVGVGKGTVTMDDFDQADAIFVFGQNPGTNHPRMLDTLRDAVRRGAQVVAINPLKERGLERFTHPQHPLEMLSGGATTMNTLYMQPKLGGDMALVRGMVKALLAAERHAEQTGGEPVFDHAFIAEHTEGLDAYLAVVDATNWDDIERQSGVTRDVIEGVAEVYRKSERVIATWAMGITQHKHSVATIQEIANWMLLRGNVGKPGAGLCPVRGHSNVQGDRTMGINERPGAAFLDALGRRFGFDVPRKHGHAVVEAIQAMKGGQSRVFFALGGNFAAATPDTAATEAALRNCGLTVQVSTKLNRSHLVTGKAALILPCLGRTEIDIQAGGAQMISVEDSMSMVHASNGVLEPASPQLKSEPAIVAGVAEALLGKWPVDWMSLIEDYDRIRELIADTVPGFEDFNERLKAPRGFYLGNAARERHWDTAGGRATFAASPLPVHLESHEGDLVLQTLRSHDQYNTTIYGLDDRYRGVFGQRRVVFVSGADLARLGLAAGEAVDLVAEWGDGIERRVSGFTLVEYDLPPGSAAAYYPETNPLVALASVGDDSRTPTSKFIPIRLEKLKG